MATSLNSLVGPALNSLSQYQTGLQTRFAQASAETAVNGSIDPSGTRDLQRAQWPRPTASTKAAEHRGAQNALNVAQGALSNTTDALQRVNTLAIEATNDFLRPRSARRCRPKRTR